MKTNSKKVKLSGYILEVLAGEPILIFTVLIILITIFGVVSLVQSDKQPRNTCKNFNINQEK